MPLQKARLKISDYNEKRKSNTKAHERRVQAVSLSLTSMVDMFAILVIFLLANNNNMTEWLKLDEAIQLPKAKTADIPSKAASIQISEKQVVGDNRVLMETKDVMKSTQAISKWLSTVKDRQGFINIVAHTNLSFGIIKRVTAVANAQGFTRINLIVQPTQ
jgi:biopolymer transport protein ExbD